MTTVTDDPTALLDTVRELGERIRTDVGEGRLDRIDATLAARERALEALAPFVKDPALDGTTRAAIDAVRDDDRRLLEWMEGEKRAVGRALQSLHGRVEDPYRDRLHRGPAVLNERR